MEFTKLCTPSLKDLFIQDLEHKILSGELKIGDKLPTERELASSMQVSRAVVNAGIAELNRRGFLVIKPRIGTFVADYRKYGTIETLIAIMNYNGGTLREDEVRSILELRIALDSLVIELSIPKITDSDLTILKECVDFIQTSTTNKEAAKFAFQFQHELALISGNTLVPLIFSSFEVPVTFLWERFCLLYGHKALYENTATLYEFIEKKDAKKAIEWLNTYLNDTINGSKPIYY